MTAMRTHLRRRLRWLGMVLVLVGVAMALGIRMGGSSPEVRWRAIQEAIDRGRWVEAEALLGRQVERHPDDSRAWLSLGSVRGILRREDEARAALRRVAAGDPAWVQAQVLLGDLALKRHERAEAERAYRAVIERNPRAIQPRMQLVFLLFVQRRTDEARALLWDLYHLTGDPRHLITLTGLALEEGPQQLRDLAGEGDRLIRDLDLFLRRDPDDPWLRRARGLLRFQLGHPAEARADLEATAELMENDPVGRLAVAECRLALGDLRGIEDRLGSVPQRPVDRGRWWLLYGRVEQERGRAEEAIACWREAAAADPQNRAAHYQLGQALLRRGRADEAGPYLDRAEAIRLRTDALKRAVHGQLGGVRDVEACEHLGRLCLESGMPAEGRAWFEQAIRIDPTRRGAQAALARIGAVPVPAPMVPRLRQGVATSPGGTAAGPQLAEAGSAARFEEVARTRGLAFQYDSGASGNLFIGETMGGGVGLLDFDDDGWLDVYFVNGCRLPVDPRDPPAPNRLFRNRGDGTFVDVTERARVGGRGYGMGCSVGDYDVDGHDDLFVTGLGSTVLYRNNGDGTFADVTKRAGVASSRWCTAAGFGDLDGDGDLDLVVVTYVDADPEDFPDCRDALGKPIHCPPWRFPAQFDHLFRNDGDGTFTDVSREAGLEVPDGRGLGLAVSDLDQDGRLDLFVANDAVPDFLFRNQGGLRFEEVAVALGAAYDGNGHATASMGVVADDLDGDGLIDLFHTNFRNEGSTLLRNLGGLFADATAQAGLDGPSRPVTGFGAVALDADNDGHLDLFAANGHVDDQPWIRQPMAQPPHWYTGRAGGRFELAPAGAVAAYFARAVVGRGAAAGDLDNDGRVDLVVVHRDAPAALLRNTSRAGHWLAVRLRGSASGRTPVGARVTCTAGGRTLVRWLTSGTSYLSAHDPRLWFGLGTAATVDELEVRWPSGAIQRRSNLPADRILDLREADEPVAGAG